MKVIKKGNLVGTRIDCHRCHAELEYVHADVRCDDRPCALPYVVCPECNAHIATVQERQY